MRDVLFSPIVDVVTHPPNTNFPDAVAYFKLDSGEELLIIM